MVAVAIKLSTIVCSKCHQPKTARKPCAKCHHDEQFGIFRTEVMMRGSTAFPLALLTAFGLFPKEDSDTQKVKACGGAARSIKFERYSADGSRLVTKPWTDQGWTIVSDTGRYA